MTTTPAPTRPAPTTPVALPSLLLGDSSDADLAAAVAALADVAATLRDPDARRTLDQRSDPADPVRRNPVRLVSGTLADGTFVHLTMPDDHRRDDAGPRLLADALRAATRAASDALGRDLDRLADAVGLAMTGVVGTTDDDQPRLRLATPWEPVALQDRNGAPMLAAPALALLAAAAPRPALSLRASRTTALDGTPRVAVEVHPVAMLCRIRGEDDPLAAMRLHALLPIVPDDVRLPSRQLGLFA